MNILQTMVSINTWKLTVVWITYVITSSYRAVSTVIVDSKYQRPMQQRDKIDIYCDSHAVHLRKQMYRKGTVHPRIDHEGPEGGGEV
jgi:hypothetical protein